VLRLLENLVPSEADMEDFLNFWVQRLTPLSLVNMLVWDRAEVQKGDTHNRNCHSINALELNLMLAPAQSSNGTIMSVSLETSPAVLHHQATNVD
jgi:hypothetical protein